MKKIMFNEVWKDIVGFEGLYEVSNYGRVRRSDTKRLKETPLNNYGYPQVNLHKNGKSHLRRIHRLVAIAFVDNPYPIKYDCINHKDENPCNNNAYNLEWCDRAYNNNYGGRNARSAISHSKAVMQYTLDGEFLKEWCSGTDASRHLSIPQAAMDCGWALALHGSLNSDMDIMAMPWVENAVAADEMIDKLAACFGFSEYWIKHQLSVDRTSKPNGRVVYTIPIHGDFYLDINVIQNQP